MSFVNLELIWGYHLQKWFRYSSWPTPDWLLINFWRTPRNKFQGLNLESCPNELSKFGEPSQWALQIWNSFWKFIWGNLDPPWTPQTFRCPQNGKLSKRALQIWLYCLFTFCTITILDCNSYYSLIPKSTTKSGCNMSYILSQFLQYKNVEPAMNLY